jgi:hypothetical protein
MQVLFNYLRISRTSGLAATFAAAIGLSACDDAVVAVQEDLPDDETTIVVNELRATIGPDGGTLDGGEDGPLAFFKLVIPAGALDEATEIVVRATVDPTPLAVTAERIGPHYAIEPAGLVLSAPAELTVAFDPALREQWDTPDDECRVWFRDGEGWSRAEPTGATPQSVTVALPKLTTVAAGVSFVSRVPACELTGSCAPTTGDQGCLAGETFCLTRLVPPSKVPFEYSSVTTANGFAYFLTSPAINQFAIAKYDLLSTNGATTSTVALTATPTTTVSSRGRIAIDSAGDLWLSLTGYGNVRFRAAAAAARFDTSSTVVPAGVVFAPSTSELYRFVISTVNGVRGLRGTTSNFSQLLIALVTGDNFVAAGLIRPIAGRTSSYGSNVVATVANTSGIAPRALSTGYTFKDPCGAATTHHHTFDTTVSQFAVGCANSTVFNSFSERPAAVGHTVSSLTVDNSGNTFVVSTSMAQLTRIDSIGGVSEVLLSTATPGTIDYDRMIPRAIRFEPSLNMLVLFTRGNNASGAPDVFLIEAFEE